MGRAVRLLSAAWFFFSLLVPAPGANAAAPTESPTSAAPASAASPEAAGDIAVVAGTVMLTSAQKGSQPRRAENGGIVFVGDTITTGKDGQIKVLLRDKTLLDLGSGSRITVQGFKSGPGNERQVDLSLDHGVVRTLVSKKIPANSKFQIRTHTAVMGVRGTEFVVEALNKSKEGPPRTAVAVIQGQVALERLSAAGSLKLAPLLIPAGSRVIFHVGDIGPSKVVAMQSSVLVALKPQTTVRDPRVENAIKVEKSGGMASNLDIAPKSAGRSTASSNSTSSTGSTSSTAGSNSSLGSSLGDDIASHVPTAPISVPGIFTPTQILTAAPAINPLAGANHSIQVTVVHP